MSTHNIARRSFVSGLGASVAAINLANANPDAGKAGGKPERGGGGDLSVDMTLQMLPLNVRQQVLYYVTAMVLLTNASFIYVFMRNGVLRRLENRLNVGFVPFLGGLVRGSYVKSDFTPSNEIGSIYLHDQTTVLLDLRSTPGAAPAQPGALSGSGALVNAPQGASTPYTATPIETFSSSSGSGQITMETRLTEVNRDFARNVGVNFTVERDAKAALNISEIVTFNDDFSFQISGAQYHSAFTPFEIDFHNRTRQSAAAARNAPMLSQIPVLGQLIGKVHHQDKEGQKLLVAVKPSVVVGYD